MRMRHRTLPVKWHLKAINVKQPAPSLSLSLSLSLSQFPSEIIAKLELTLNTAQQTRTIHTNRTNNGGNNKQCINNSKTTALERSAEVSGVGVNYFSLQNIRPRFCCYMSNQRKKTKLSRTGFLTNIYPIYLFMGKQSNL